MKYLLPLFFVMLSLLTVASCKKADDIDPRDQFVGNYDITSTSYIPAGSGSLGSVKASSQTTKNILNVTKSSKTGVLLLSDASSSEVYIITLKEDNIFVLDPIYRTSHVSSGITYQLSINGDGRFLDKSIKMNVNASAPAIGLTQTISVVGTKR